MERMDSFFFEEEEDEDKEVINGSGNVEFLSDYCSFFRENRERYFELFDWMKIVLSYN